MANPESSPVVTVKWGPTEDLPLLIADQLHWRTLADRCYLTVGQMDFPVQEGIISVIPIRPLAKFVLTPEVLRIFAKIVADAAGQFPEAKPSETK